MTNEMSNSKTQRKRRGWPEKRRKKQAQNCRKAKPWKKTTGPKTDAGKEICKMNAYKHGGRCAEIREMHKILTAHHHFLRRLNKRIAIVRRFLRLQRLHYPDTSYSPQDEALLKERINKFLIAGLWE